MKNYKKRQKDIKLQSSLHELYHIRTAAVRRKYSTVQLPRKAATADFTSEQHGKCS